MAVLAICLATTGCLVTEAYDYPEQADEPPTLTGGPVGLELAHILEVTPDSDPGILTFSVVVHDPDVDEVLFMRRRLVSVNPETGILEQSLQTGCDKETRLDPEVPAMQGVDRAVEFSFSTEELVKDRCHVLEFAVSPVFQLHCRQLPSLPPTLDPKGNLFTTPDEPGNGAVGRWYIKWTTGTGEDRVVCPSETVQQVGLGL